MLLAGHVQHCSALAPQLRWVPPANLHLTLRFLGRTPAPLLRDVVDRLRQVPLRPFRIALGGAGTFSRGARARVCWVGVTAGLEPLRELAGRIETACAESGLPTESKAYNPHLTLARARERDGVHLPPLPETPELPAWCVESFSLYESNLGPGGPTYSIVEEFS